jgi:hypothetical protein
MFHFDVNRTARAAWTMGGMTGCLALIFTQMGCGRIHDARMADNEASAITEVRQVQNAQTRYCSQIGHYAASLGELEKAGFIDAKLANVIHNGYRYRLGSTQNGYTISATPNAFDDTGGRSFFSDETKVIHQHNGPEVASAADPEVR